MTRGLLHKQRPAIMSHNRPYGLDTLRDFLYDRILSVLDANARSVLCKFRYFDSSELYADVTSLFYCLWAAHGAIIRYHQPMTTSSNGNVFRVTGHLCGEFTGEFPTQRPVKRSFNFFFDLCLKKRLSGQSWGWWFETPSRSLSRHCNGSRNKQIYNTKIVVATGLFGTSFFLKTKWYKMIF